MALKMTAVSVAFVLSNAVFPASAQQIDPIADALTEKLQAKFAEAYNRKDVMTMAGFFSEKGWRICRDLAGGISRELKQDADWQMELLDEFKKPVFRIRLIAETKD